MKNLEQVADLVVDMLYEAHRGVIHLRDGDFLIFGNDGFSEESGRARHEVAKVREHLAEQADEIGFATDSDTGDTWVLHVRLRKPITTAAGIEAFRHLTTRVLWQAWMGDDVADALGDLFDEVQTQIAEEAIQKFKEELAGFP